MRHQGFSHASDCATNRLTESGQVRRTASLANGIQSVTDGELQLHRQHFVHPRHSSKSGMSSSVVRIAIVFLLTLALRLVHGRGVTGQRVGAAGIGVTGSGGDIHIGTNPWVFPSESIMSFSESSRLPWRPLHRLCFHTDLPLDCPRPQCSRTISAMCTKWTFLSG